MPKKKAKKKDYGKAAKQASIVSGMTHALATKGNVKNTLLETGKDLLIGVVGGGLVGAAIGKPSLLVGLGMTGVGHYTESHLATLVGIGMMAANGFQQSKTVEGLDGMDMKSVTGRLTAYKDNFLEKTYLDKVIHPKETAKSKEVTNGMGNLQFFNYGQDTAGIADELNGELSALDSIERQIEESGRSHMEHNGIGTDDVGDVGEFDYTDASDFNL